MEDSTQGLDKPARNVGGPGPYRFRDYSEAAVAAACEGRPDYLSPAERCEAIRRLTAEGLTGSQIAALLGCRRRTVERARQALRERAAA